MHLSSGCWALQHASWCCCQANVTAYIRRPLEERDSCKRLTVGTTTLFPIWLVSSTLLSLILLRRSTCPCGVAAPNWRYTRRCKPPPNTAPSSASPIPSPILTCSTHLAACYVIPRLLGGVRKGWCQPRGRSNGDMDLSDVPWMLIGVTHCPCWTLLLEGKKRERRKESRNMGWGLCRNNAGWDLSGSARAWQIFAHMHGSSAQP